MSVIFFAKNANMAKMAESAKMVRLAKMTKFANLARMSKMAKFAKMSKIARMAKKAKVAKVTKMAKMAKVAKIAKIATIAKIAEIGKIAKIAKIANIANIAEIAKIAAIAEIAKIAEIAEIAKITETEIVMFLKTFKIWVFSEKVDGFFGKKLKIYSKSLKLANLLLNAHRMVLFLKNVFRPIYEIFWQRIRKLLTLEELETMLKKECFFREKNVFIFLKFLKAFFTKMGMRKICRWYPAVLLE